MSMLTNTFGDAARKLTGVLPVGVMPPGYSPATSLAVGRSHGSSVLAPKALRRHTYAAPDEAVSWNMAMAQENLKSSTLMWPQCADDASTMRICPVRPWCRRRSQCTRNMVSAQAPVARSIESPSTSSSTYSDRSLQPPPIKKLQGTRCTPDTRANIVLGFQLHWVHRSTQPLTSFDRRQ